MNSPTARPRPRVIPTVLLLVVGTQVQAHAQTGREALRLGNDAADVFDYATAKTLLSRGLDPSAGDMDSLWAVGLHKLTESLHQLGDDSLAAVWARWAAREMPDMPLNDVEFTTAVIRLLEQGREFVATNGYDVLVVEPHFEWMNAAGEAPRGRLALEQSEVPVSGLLEQPRQYVSPGEQVALPPGSYTIAIAAAGVLPTRFTVEVLPGVTTVVRLTLLTDDAGYLYVTTQPWGIVQVDGKPLGYTTIAGRRIAPGEHTIRVSRDGYLPIDSTITVAPAERVRLGPITLQPIQGGQQ